MGCYANGDALFTFQTTDRGIYEKVQKAFKDEGFMYDFDIEIGKDTIEITAWGNERENLDIEAVLEKLTEFAPIEERSWIAFDGDDNERWRYIYKRGEWKYQEGKIVYYDI